MKIHGKIGGLRADYAVIDEIGDWSKVPVTIGEGENKRQVGTAMVTADGAVICEFMHEDAKLLGITHLSAGMSLEFRPDGSNIHISEETRERLREVPATTALSFSPVEWHGIRKAIADRYSRQISGGENSRGNTQT